MRRSGLACKLWHSATPCTRLRTVEAGGTTVRRKEVRRAELVRGTPAFFGWERTVVRVHVDAACCSPPSMRPVLLLRVLKKVVRQQAKNIAVFGDSWITSPLVLAHQNWL